MLQECVSFDSAITLSLINMTNVAVNSKVSQPSLQTRKTSKITNKSTVRPKNKTRLKSSFASPSVAKKYTIEFCNVIEDIYRHEKIAHYMLLSLSADSKRYCMPFKIPTKEGP